MGGAREPAVEEPWRDDIATCARLVAAGVNRRTVRDRVRRGSWQEPAPGVLCRTTGGLTVDQWLLAALLYGGPSAMLSHGTAGGFWGFATAPTTVHITVVHGTNLRSTDRIAVHQTLRECRPSFIDGLMLSPPPRTAMDMALAAPDQRAVDALFGKALQSRQVTVEELSDELVLAPSRGSRFARIAIAAVAAGSRSAAEAQFFRLVRRAQLPEPELNAPVETRAGVRYVDALWRHLGKGVEIDGRAYHLAAEAWQNDLGRQNAIQSTGIVLLRIAAGRLWTEPDVVIAEIRAFLGC